MEIVSHEADTAILAELGAAAREGRVISDAAARAVAWQISGVPDLEAFAATGAIDVDLHFVLGSLRSALDPRHPFKRVLEALESYVASHGARPAVPGWPELRLRRRRRGSRRGDVIFQADTTGETR